MFKRPLPILALTTIAITQTLQAGTLSVPSASYPTLPIAINAAASGDEIVLAPGQYIAVPGFVINNKQLTLRGSSSNPADTVLDGFDVADNVVLTITGSGSSDTTLQNLTVTGGLNTSSGAGISSNTSITLIDCVVRDNGVTGFESDGPALYTTAGNVTCTRCTFSGNSIVEAGDAGAVFVISGNVIIEDCTFTDNGQDPAAIDTEARGGALRVDSGSLSLRRTTFVDNRCGRGGALFVSQDAHLYIDACVFRDNSAWKGAGLYISGTTAGRTRVIRNTLFDGNMTSSNDAALFTDRPLTVTNCTIVNNMSGGDYILGGSPPANSVIVDNCILWGNTGSVLLPAPMAAIVRRSTLQSAYAAAGPGSGNNTLDDPRFLNDASNFRLRPNSPAIDAGDSNLYFGPFADLDGNLRGVDIPAVADTGFSIDGPVIDRGCYEHQPEVVTPGCSGDVTGDHVVDFADLNELLENWGTMCP
ncbi:MAG: right-handed parallel beta-helix repeat-containing protein [Phycisphaerales bacterium]|nr:right-handed parallel beta-helix repeat-containing protein [Phycisphaerales bacterium]